MSSLQWNKCLPGPSPRYLKTVVGLSILFCLCHVIFQAVLLILDGDYGAILDYCKYILFHLNCLLQFPGTAKLMCWLWKTIWICSLFFQYLCMVIQIRYVLCQFIFTKFAWKPQYLPLMQCTGFLDSSASFIKLNWDTWDLRMIL